MRKFNGEKLSQTLHGTFLHLNKFSALEPWIQRNGRPTNLKSVLVNICVVDGPTYRKGKAI